MNKLIARFTFIILVSFIVVQPALSQKNDSINLLDEPCHSIFSKKGAGQDSTELCLELVKKFESKNIINEDYLLTLWLLGNSALLSADYGIANEAFEKSMEYIENNYVEDQILEMTIIESYIHFLLLHKDKNSAKTLILKYLPRFKNKILEIDKEKNQQSILIIALEKYLAEIYVGEIHTNEKELQDAKIILENHLNFALQYVEEIWEAMGVKDKHIYISRNRTLLLYADLLRRLGDSKEGLNYKFQALDLAESKLLARDIAYVYQDIGLYYHLWVKDYENAIKYYKDAINIFETDLILKKEYLYLITLDGIASSYWFLDQADLGYPYSKKAADISLKRLYGQIDVRQLLSTNEELNKTKERIKTHIDNIYRISFSEEISQEKRSFLIEESIYYGQLLPQLKTAQALSYLQPNNEIQNEKIKNFVQEKSLLEEKLGKLLSKRDNARSQEIINYEKLREINKSVNETSQKINKTIKAIQKLSPFFTSFNLRPASINEILLMLDDDEALFFYHESFKPREYQEWQEETKNITLQGWIISREFTHMMLFGSFNKKNRKVYQLNFADHSNLISHLDFSNTSYLSSDFPTDLSHNIYKAIFGDYLELPFSYKIKKLIIVNDGILYKVPYWALTTEPSSPNIPFKDQPWLAKKYAVTITPSVRSFVDLRKMEKRVLGVSLDINEEGLIKITHIYDNFFASNNNLEIGDLILKINGTNFIHPNQIAKSPSEKPIKLLISRNRKQHTIVMPPLIKNNFQESETNYFDFVGIGNPSGLKGNESDLASTTKSLSFNELFGDIDNVTRGVNKRAIQEMPALPGTEKELKAIARNFDSNKVKLFLQNEATETTIKDADLSNIRYISFASHAVVAGEIGEFDEPGIVLTPPNSSSEEDDGLLTASEITQLKMNADLVILSACNTGAGSDDSPSAEGLTGLARSFFIAGNKELVVSNWRVTDEYAAKLTTGMLDYLTTKENVTKAEALQYSINELIDENLHPIFWAPFMLVGDGL